MWYNIWTGNTYISSVILIYKNNLNPIFKFSVKVIWISSVFSCLWCYFPLFPLFSPFGQSFPFNLIDIRSSTWLTKIALKRILWTATKVLSFMRKRHEYPNISHPFKLQCFAAFTDKENCNLEQYHNHIPLSSPAI